MALIHWTCLVSYHHTPSPIGRCTASKPLELAYTGPIFDESCFFDAAALALIRTHKSPQTHFHATLRRLKDEVLNGRGRAHSWHPFLTCPSPRWHQILHRPCCREDSACIAPVWIGTGTWLDGELHYSLPNTSISTFFVVLCPAVGLLLLPAVAYIYSDLQ